jgi:hypothetical protein
MAMLIRLMKTAITPILLNKMIRGVIIGLAVKSMKQIITPTTISAIMTLATILLSFIKSKKQDNSKSGKQKDQVIDIENYSVSD